ncbi:hypothetical protein SDC9_147252 [bioreactor metagenome]|uniref:Divergent PAP2 family protein n=1 Tax=bioreactor metagenome TaxID=1076179 RepID=A0A645EDI3_9ZZZZ
MELINGLTRNYIISTAIVAWIAAQFLKLVCEYFTTKKIDIGRFLTGAGGMPSSHAAVVTSVCVQTFKVCGQSSPEFAIAVVLAVIVMYDASGVRRAAGEQAKVLNTIIEKWQDPVLLEKQLEEFLGHSPFQVFAGAILGILIGIFL